MNSAFYRTAFSISWLLPLALLASNLLHAQVAIEANPDSVEAELALYNAQRMEFEYLLKKRECASDLKKLKDSFTQELALLDSLLGTTTLAEIPGKYSGKLIIISPYKADDGCLYVTYAKKKYPKGCEFAFYPDSVKFSAYINYQKAVAEKQLCVIKMDGSGFTQVEKIQNVEVSEKSAAELLDLIKRTTDLYSDVLGVTYPQYLSYEQKKNLKTLKDKISVRVQFLTLSKQRIAK